MLILRVRVEVALVIVGVLQVNRVPGLRGDHSRLAQEIAEDLLLLLVRGRPVILTCLLPGCDLLDVLLLTVADDGTPLLNIAGLVLQRLDVIV